VEDQELCCKKTAITEKNPNHIGKLHVFSSGFIIKSKSYFPKLTATSFYL